VQITAFCVVMVYSLVEIYELLEGPVSCMFCPEVGGFVPESKFHVIKE